MTELDVSTPTVQSVPTQINSHVVYARCDIGVLAMHCIDPPDEVIVFTAGPQPGLAVGWLIVCQWQIMMPFSRNRLIQGQLGAGGCNRSGQDKRDGNQELPSLHWLV